MPEDATLLDLGYLALWGFCWGALQILLTVAAAVAAFLDFNVSPIPGVTLRPFSGVAGFIQGDIIEPVQDAQSGVERQLAKGFYGLVNSLITLAGLTLLLAVGVKDLFVWLWGDKINPLVESVARALGSYVAAVAADLAALRSTLQADVSTLYRYVDASVEQAAQALVHYADAVALDAEHRADAFADQAVANLAAVEEKAIQHAVDLANAAASTAAADLRTAEEYTDHTVTAAAGALTTLIEAAKNAAEEAAADALGAAVGKLNDAIADARAAAASGVATAEADAKRLVGDAVDTLSDQVSGLAKSTNKQLAELAASASSALASASGALSTEITTAVSGAEQIAAGNDQAVTAALDQVKSIAITAETDVQTLAGAAGIAGSAALIASIPALATLVYAIANEAGLSNSECRQKVGKVCSVDPSAWEGLLAGLASIGLLLSLQEIVDAAEELIPVVSPLLAEAV